MKSQELIFTNNVGEAIDKLLTAANPSKIFILTDVNTNRFVLPRLLEQSKTAAGATVITTKAGDMNKNLESLAAIWKRLGDEGATRDSILVNLGGGVITDMGGFAAASFKRGISFINIPTTLLGAVDAAVGGKTGINFGNLKNQIGAFCNAEAVIISTVFFSSLDARELRSGYAEMLKHGLLKDEATFNSLIEKHIEELNSEELLKLLEQSVLVKRDVVLNDPTEKGLRRALNLGHTPGHAFESLALERKLPIPHGYAVAYGLVTDLVLSHMKLGFPSSKLHRLAAYIKEVYSGFEYSCDDYPRLLEFMRNDKKNHTTDAINFTLLREIGDVKIDCVIPEEEIKEALDITRDLLGI